MTDKAKDRSQRFSFRHDVVTRSKRSYRFCKMVVMASKIYSGSRFSDGIRLWRSESICRPNFHKMHIVVANIILLSLPVSENEFYFRFAIWS